MDVLDKTTDVCAVHKKVKERQRKRNRRHAYVF